MWYGSHLIYCEDDGYWVYKMDRGRQAGPFETEGEAKAWIEAKEQW